MADTVSDFMTPNPITLEASQTVTQAAQLMRDNNTGAIVILDQGAATGILTDRDIALRVVADQKNPNSPIGDIINSHELTSVAPDTTLDQAVQLMRTKAIRRLPVLQGDQPVGMISLGDLAIARDRTSALADISAANPNN